jgi:hypothetical protein
MVEIPSKMVVGTANEMNAFQVNMLENEVEVVKIFSTEVTMLWSGPPSRNRAGCPPTQVKWVMIWNAVQHSVAPEWQSQFEAMLLRYASMISEQKRTLVTVKQ